MKEVDEFTFENENSKKSVEVGSFIKEKVGHGVIENKLEESKLESLISKKISGSIKNQLDGNDKIAMKEVYSSKSESGSDKAQKGKSGIKNLEVISSKNEAGNEIEMKLGSRNGKFVRNIGISCSARE